MLYALSPFVSTNKRTTNGVVGRCPKFKSDHFHAQMIIVIAPTIQFDSVELESWTSRRCSVQYLYLKSRLKF